MLSTSKIRNKKGFPPLYRFSETSVLLDTGVEFGAFGLSLNKNISQFIMSTFIIKVLIMKYGKGMTYLLLYSWGRLRRPQ